MEGGTETGIIATVGPVSSSAEVLRGMIGAGMDVVRLNFSHGTREERLERLEIVRRLSGEIGEAVGVMADLEGNRIRIGEIAGAVHLNGGEEIFLVQGEGGGDGEVPFDYLGSLEGVSCGDIVYVDDGRVRLEVVTVAGDRLKVRAQTESVIEKRKGVNIPGAKLEFGGLSEQDRGDIGFAVREGVDCLSQSFVNSAEDVRSVREVIGEFGGEGIEVYAKLESRDGISRIDEIIEESDGIIVARGDLGICAAIEKVPMLQKEIIKKCRERGKPVAVATQMLESMTAEWIPTRAEVSDVANAILDGANFCMLSAETSVGRYPVRVVEVMDSIIKAAEGYRDGRMDIWGEGDI